MTYTMMPINNREYRLGWELQAHPTELSWARQVWSSDHSALPSQAHLQDKQYSNNTHSNNNNNKNNVSNDNSISATGSH